MDGSLRIEAKPGSLLGFDGNLGHVGGQEDPSLLSPTALSIADRPWKLIVAGQTSIGVASR